MNKFNLSNPFGSWTWFNYGVEIPILAIAGAFAGLTFLYSPQIGDKIRELDKKKAAEVFTTEFTNCMKRGGDEPTCDEKAKAELSRRGFRSDRSANYKFMSVEMKDGKAVATLALK